MKPDNIRLIIVLFLGLVVTQLVTEAQWDIAIYSILAIVFISNALEGIYWLIRMRKGPFAEGHIIKTETANNSSSKSSSDQELESEIQFKSPLDGCLYIVQYAYKHWTVSSPKNPVKVWVNVKQISKSRVVEPDYSLSLLLIFGKLMAGFAFIVLVVIMYNK